MPSVFNKKHSIYVMCHQIHHGPIPKQPLKEQEVGMAYEQYQRGGRVVACSIFPFVEVWAQPGESCIGCSHWMRIRADGIQEWLLSEACPCLECLTRYWIAYGSKPGGHHRLPCWTNDQLEWFREEEFDLLPPGCYPPFRRGIHPLQYS